MNKIIPFFSIIFITGMFAAPTQALAVDKLVCKRCVHTRDIAKRAVATNRIRAGAVTNSRIADGAVTSTKIAVGAVDTSHIVDGSITAADLATDSVFAQELAPDAVGTAHISTGAVTAAKVGSGIAANGDVLTADGAGGANWQPKGPAVYYYSGDASDFTPRRGADAQYFENGFGNGGAYFSSLAGTLGMVAPAHLPHGAVITAFTVFFDDTSANDMNVILSTPILTSSQIIITTVTSAGTAGLYNIRQAGLNVPVDNQTKALHIMALPVTTWDGFALQIKGFTIEYTLP